MNAQNNRERLMDQLSRGLITADQANVQMVRNERVRLVTKLSREDRNALNKAVKEKKLGHLKKDGLKPEAYFHPNFDYLARSKRNAAMEKGIRALKAICV